MVPDCYGNWGVESYPCPLGGSSPVYREVNSKGLARRINFLKELLISIDWRCFVFYLKSHLSLIGIGCPEGYFKIVSHSVILWQKLSWFISKIQQIQGSEHALHLLIKITAWRQHHTVRQALAYITLGRAEASTVSLYDCEHSCLLLGSQTANYPNGLDEITYHGGSSILT